MALGMVTVEGAPPAAAGTTNVELMSRYCAGDAAALRELYRRCAPTLLTQLGAVVHDRAAAEDLLQQTFIKVHQARARYIAGADPLPWLASIARRTALDELRRRKRARVQLAFADAEVPDVAVDISGVAPEAQRAGVEEAIACCLGALPALPPEQRRAVQLTKLEGRSVAEAARIEGVTTGALRVRAHRGYLALRRLFLAATAEPVEG